MITLFLTPYICHNTSWCSRLLFSSAELAANTSSTSFSIYVCDLHEMSGGALQSFLLEILLMLLAFAEICACNEDKMNFWLPRMLEVLLHATERCVGLSFRKLIFTHFFVQDVVIVFNCSLVQKVDVICLCIVRTCSQCLVVIDGLINYPVSPSLFLNFKNPNYHAKFDSLNDSRLNVIDRRLRFSTTLIVRKTYC